jgi:soluble lytic murein transglycosylase-like protein
MSDYQIPMSEDRAHQMIAWRRIVTKAWNDESFRADLLANPNSVLAANGFPVDPNTSYSIAADSSGQQTLVLPPAPSDLDVTSVSGNSDADPGF